MEDMAALNVVPPDFAPRATAYVSRMVDMIQRLIDGGYAYVAEKHVLFEVAKDPSYGILSRRDREAMVAGARVEVAPYKRDAADFVLWKPAGETAEQVALSFPSPWGAGRPGWHIECSAMIEAFGSRSDAGHVETIDIHGGGLDLIFPHHENEIAQSRCAHAGAPLARFWVHNGFVDMGSDKMSKSLGNIVTPEELLAQGHKGETLRLALLSAHYRQPLPWTEALVEQSKSVLDRWYDTLVVLSAIPSAGTTDQVIEAVVDELSDDLNVPAALAALNEHHDALRQERNRVAHGTGGPLNFQDVALNRDIFINSAKLLGLLECDPREWFSVSISDEEVEKALKERSQAKVSRDFATADRIRAELVERGVQLEDKPDGTTFWRRA
jgi:cysteinyl-tRNA synthetase